MSDFDYLLSAKAKALSASVAQIKEVMAYKVVENEECADDMVTLLLSISAEDLA